MLLDQPLLTVLIERWRFETSSFHLRVGEMTIILQDVPMLLEFPIDSLIVIERDDRDWMAKYARILGRQLHN